MGNQPESSDAKGTKRDFSTAMLERKKAPNRLVVAEAVNDDNSVVALHPETMEKFQLFRCDTILIKALIHVFVSCQKKLVVDWILATNLVNATVKENPDVYKAAWKLLKVLMVLLFLEALPMTSMQLKRIVDQAIT